jgi:riboflavin transporter FmnP
MDVRKLVVLGVLSAIAFVLMATIQFPILPQAPYLRYDPSDAVALLGGVLYGPGPAVAVVFLKDVLYLLFRARGPFGPLADFVAAATFVAATSWAYHRGRGSLPTRLLRAAALGTLARVVVMVPANFVILHLQFGMPPERVATMLLPVFVPFNAVKAAANALLALFILTAALRHVVPGGVPEPPGR